MYLDAHIHLLDIDDAATAQALISRVAEGDAVRLFCNTVTEDQWNGAQALAGAVPDIVPFFGIHPWFSGDVRAGWDERLETRLSGTCGIGEIGLDTLQGPPLEEQKKVFCRQVEIACNRQKPFTLHCVRAWGDIVGLLRKSRHVPPFIVHAFGSSLQVLGQLLDLGGYISFWLKDIERRPDKIAPLITAVPLERLLLETDYPNCFHGEQAPYADCLKDLYEGAARLRGTDAATLGRTVLNNGTILADRAAARQR